MNAKLLPIIAVAASVIFAQSDQKFQLYGFADMTLTKYFPKENSVVRNVDKMDERFMFSFDHLNLYQDYRPNDRVRFLSEFSYQDKPPYYKDQNGMRIIIGSGPMVFLDSVFTQPAFGDTNKVMKGIVNYEWGSFSVERAQMSIAVNRYANFTFGKFITPAGIWNVDHGSPVIMTVNQPSQYTFREIFPKSQLGIMEGGTVFVGDGDVTYTMYLSSGRGNPVIKNVNELAAGGQMRLSLPLLDEFGVGVSGYTGSQTAVYRSLTLKMMSSLINPAGDPFDPANQKTTTTYAISDERLFKYRENVFGADVRVKHFGIALQAEFNYLQAVNKMPINDDSVNSGIMGTYVLGSYDAYKSKNFSVVPYGFWEYVLYSGVDNNPSLFNGFVVPEKAKSSVFPYGFLGYMKLMAGVNMRFYSNFGLKTEYNFTRLLNIKEKTRDEIAEDKDGLSDIPGVAAQFYVAF